ncbi:MAG: hypothetical protein O7D86_00780 [Proteobacteria bacterium]|nr:hypothetical protein [Pseudomonadota bacterium]
MTSNPEPNYTLDTWKCSVQSVTVFIQGKARRCAWPPPAKRSNAAMDENGRAMDIAFPGVMGIYQSRFLYLMLGSEYQCELI